MAGKPNPDLCQEIMQMASRPVLRRAIFTSHEPAFTLVYLSVSILISKLLLERSAKFYLHETGAFLIQSSKLFHIPLTRQPQRPRNHIGRFITASTPLLGTNSLYSLISSSPRQKQLKRENLHLDSQFEAYIVKSWLGRCGSRTTR